MVQYVLDDGAAGKAHRLQKGAYRFVGRLDGERTVEQLWERLVEELGEDAPTQDDVISALGQLHGSDLLATEMLPDTGELLKRHKQQGPMGTQARWDRGCSSVKNRVGAA